MRQGSSRTWRAMVDRGRVYPGAKAKGAVAYSTAGWKGEGQEGEIRAIVLVFMDPSHSDDEDWMAAEARRLADRMFMRRHPDAQLEEQSPGNARDEGEPAPVKGKP